MDLFEKSSLLLRAVRAAEEKRVHQRVLLGHREQIYMRKHVHFVVEISN